MLALLGASTMNVNCTFFSMLEELLGTVLVLSHCSKARCVLIAVDEMQLSRVSRSRLTCRHRAKGLIKREGRLWVLPRQEKGIEQNFQLSRFYLQLCSSRNVQGFIFIKTLLFYAEANCTVIAIQISEHSGQYKLRFQCSILSTMRLKDCNEPYGIVSLGGKNSMILIIEQWSILGFFDIPVEDIREECIKYESMHV